VAIDPPPRGTDLFPAPVDKAFNGVREASAKQNRRPWATDLLDSSAPPTGAPTEFKQVNPSCGFVGFAGHSVDRLEGFFVPPCCFTLPTAYPAYFLGKEF
jgi:hypothetical protein